MKSVKSFCLLLLLSGVLGNSCLVFSMENIENKIELSLNDQFIKAAGSGDLNKTKEFLNSSFKDIDCKDDDGNTALMFAAGSGHEEVVQLLIDNGANVNEKNNNGLTPLLFASGEGRKDVVQLLINNKANVNARSRFDCTALFFAVANDHEDVVKVLIGNKLNIDAKDNGGYTALMLAVKIGCENMLKILLEAGADFEVKANDGFTALLAALFCGNKSAVELLIDYGADKSGCDLTGMSFLFDLDSFIGLSDQESNKFKEDRFEALLSFIGNINIVNPANDKTILMHLLDFNDNNFDHQKFVKLVLDYGANINFKNSSGDSIYSVATRNNRKQLIFNYIDNCINELKNIIKNDKNLDLNECVSKFKELLFKVGSVKIKDKNGDNLLHHAIKLGNFEFVKIIYSLAPKLIAQVNNKGETPLSFSFSNNGFYYHQLCDFLKLNYQTALNKKNNKVQDIIFDHILDLINNKKYGHLASCLKNNFNYVNVKNISQYTPLHCAAMSGNITMVILLLKFKADINAESIFGEKPIDIAQKYGYQEIVTLLEDHLEFIWPSEQVNKNKN